MKNFTQIFWFCIQIRVYCVNALNNLFDICFHMKIEFFLSYNKIFNIFLNKINNKYLFRKIENKC